MQRSELIEGHWYLIITNLGELHQKRMIGKKVNVLDKAEYFTTFEIDGKLRGIPLDAVVREVDAPGS